MGNKFLKSLRQLSRRVTLVMLSGTLIVGTVAFSKAGAVSDTTPMNFTSLSISTNTINVNEGVVQVILNGQVHDDISGYGTIQFYYTSPSGAQVYEGNAGSPDGISTFDGSIDFQRFAEPGLWKPTFTLSDASGNKQTLTSAELTAAGYNMDVNVISDTPDLEPPTILDLGARNLNVILYDEPETLQIGAIVTDNEPGELTVIGRFVSPSGNQVISNVSSFTQVENPDEHMLYPRFHPNAEAGIWNVYLTLRDKAGNTVNLDPDDFAVILGDRMEIGINTQQSDTTPVTINNLSFDAASPQFDNIPEGGGAISIFADLSDNLSGLDSGYLVYRSQDSQQVSDMMGLTIDDAGKFRFNTQLPPYAAGGVWLPEITTYDIAGNRQVLQHSDLLALGYDLSINLTQNVSETLSAGQSITTDENNTGATAEAPVQSTVQTPVEGLVSIVTLDLDSNVSATNGYLLVGQQINIHAPEATVESPLSLTFQIDASTLEAGQNAQNVAIFRNGVLVEQCIDQTTANPSPCIYSRQTLPSGDIEVKVHTAAASAWTLGFPVTQEHLFKGFKKPIKQAPALNKIEAGENVAVKFNYSDGSSLNILANGSPTTQEIDCNTNLPIGEASVALSTNGQGLKLNSNDRYRYNWKTLKKWKNTCRQLTFTFTNGETATAYFKLKD